MRKTYSNVAVCVGIIASLAYCGGGHGGLKHGILETSSGPVFWVALHGEVQFLIAIDRPERLTEHENWQGTEFNVYCDVRQSDGRAPIMVYGDMNEGIITAAYADLPLDLDEGMFFSARGGQVTVLSPSEKNGYLAQIDP